MFLKLYDFKEKNSLSFVDLMANTN